MAQGKQTVSEDEILTKMQNDTDPAYTTAELAEMFNLTTEGMRRRLESLSSEGTISRKKPTKRTVIWWVESAQSESISSA